MQLKTEIQDGVAIITMSGKLIFDDSLLLLRHQVRTLLDRGQRQFILDITNVPHCDSSGCGEIIGVHASVTRAGGVIAIVGMSERIRTLWTRVRLLGIFKIYDTLSEALNQGQSR